MVTATLSWQTVVSSQGRGALIFHPKARTVLRLTLAPVIEPRCRYVSMPKPLLNLCDIGIVGESFRCHKRVFANTKRPLAGIGTPADCEKPSSPGPSAAIPP